MIPAQLEKEELRFCRILPGSKKPFEKDWVKNPYTYKEIEKFNDENYGVVCGYGNLAVLDSDNPKLQEYVEKNLPETYRVKTGSGGRHNYFFVPGLKAKIILHDLETSDHLGELQGMGAQVIGPGSKHPNGNFYEELNTYPIATMSFEEMFSKLSPFMKQIKEVQENAEYERKEESEIDNLDVEHIWGSAGMKKQGDEYYGSHPIHGSSGGMNFWINPGRNTWHCFRCNSGGGPLSAIAVKEGIIQCDQARRGYLRGDKAVEAIKIAQEKYGLKKSEGEVKEAYDIGKINWTDKEFYDSWDRVKARSINVMKEKDDLLFLAHRKDEIIGKPIQIHQTYQKLPLVSMVEKNKPKDGEDAICYKFLGDKTDYRHERLLDILAFDFMIYKVVYKNREIVLLSREELPQQVIRIKGMLIEMNNFSEITETLKFRSIARVFIVDSFEQSVRCLSKQDLVDFCKNLGYSRQDFRNMIFKHPDGKIYQQPEDYQIIRSAQILSGKYEGYPLHSLTLGPAGTGKTMELEALDMKFKEDKGILEAANSTPKALIPAFKEKPASPGYVLSCNRIALVDELMKMIENVTGTGRYQELVRGYLGQLNMLMEHKKRFIGSGNDNSLLAQATAKVVFQSNPVQGRGTLIEHLRFVDKTTLSRMLIWIQDKEHQEFILNNKPLNYINSSKNTLKTKQPPTTLYSSQCVFTEIDSIFCTIYDSCNVFLSEFDENRVDSIFREGLGLIPRDLRELWTARGLHHTTLLLDGIVKERCLFEHHDAQFIAKDEDYDVLERVVIHMLKTWTTNFNQDEWKGVFK